MNEDARYNLRLSKTAYEKLGRIADEQGVTRLELMRKYISLGLYLADGRDLYIKDKNGHLEKVVIL